jgi:hypothetical protein
MTTHEFARPYIDTIWPANISPPQKWDARACGVNSNGTTPVYGPFPSMPRLELGDRCGEFHEVRFQTWYAQLFPFEVYAIFVRRRFMLIEPTPGSLTWEEVP